MDFEKRIKALEEENEFLQGELEDATKMLMQKEKTVEPTKENHSPAYINSQIELNKIEIEHIKQKLQEQQKKANAFQSYNEELELDLLHAHKTASQQKETIKELTANQIHVSVIQEELDEMSNMLKRIKTLKSEVARLNSTIEIQQLEIDQLKANLAEQEAYVHYLKSKKS
jgi:chromosome segregation ATPase